MFDTKEMRMKSEKAKEILLSIILTIIICALIGLCFLPVIINFYEATIFVKILMISGGVLLVGAYIAFTIFFIKLCKKKDVERFKEHFGDNYKAIIISLNIIVVLFIVFSSLHYISPDLWGYDLTVFAIFFITVYIILLTFIIKNFLGSKFNNEIKPIVVVSISIFLVIIAAASLYIGEKTYAELYFKISIGLFYFILLTMFINKSIGIKENKEKNKIGFIMSRIFWGAIFAFAFPFYIKWFGLKDDHYQIFLTVYAALIAGFLTLLGVVLTINNNEESRKKDRERLEQDRKAEEIKKCVPYLKISNERPDDAISFSIINKIDLSVNGRQYYSIKIQGFCLKNISNSIVIINGIKYNGKEDLLQGGLLLEKDKVCYFDLEKTRTIYEELAVKIDIFISDIMGNKYIINGKLENQLVSPNPIKYSIEDGTTINCWNYRSEIKNISLPQPVKEQTNE